MSEEPFEVTPPPEGGKGKEDEVIEEEISEEEESGQATFISQNAAMISEITNAMVEVELSSFHNSNFDVAQNGQANNSGIGIGGPPDSPSLGGANAAVQSAARIIAEQPEAARQWNAERFLGILVGLAGLAGSIVTVYTLVRAEIDEERREDVPLPEDIKAKIRALVKKWWARPDKDFWEDLAVAVDEVQPKLTLEDQILFMNYVIDLSPITPWIWRSAEDLKAVIDELHGAYAVAGSETSAMYRLVPTLTYADANGTPVPLPRGVSATCLRYALSIILIDPEMPPGEAMPPG